MSWAVVVKCQPPNKEVNECDQVSSNNIVPRHGQLSRSSCEDQIKVVLVSCSDHFTSKFDECLKILGALARSLTSWGETFDDPSRSDEKVNDYPKHIQVMNEIESSRILLDERSVFEKGLLSQELNLFPHLCEFLVHLCCHCGSVIVANNVA